VTSTEILQLFAGVLFGLAVWSFISERRIMGRLRQAGAISAAAAVPLAIDNPVARFRLLRLLKAGAVVEASTGRYFLHRDAYQRYRDSRRKRVLAAMVILLAVLTLLRRTFRW
jgi:hypothetical protein